MAAELSGKIIIVTGAGGGIGRAAVITLARAGAQVIATDVEPERGEQTIQAARSAGASATFIRADLANEAEIESLVDATVSRFGRLDGAFNNAGIEHAARLLHELTLSEWERVIRIDLTSVFLCLKYQIRAMLACGSGSIVNTASGLGQVAMPKACEYVSAKHGVIGLTRAAATDYGARGIRVNAVLPGVVRTPMVARLMEDPALTQMFEASRARHSVGRFAEPEEVAEAVKWLLSGAASFVNGSALAVDGGFLAN